MDPDHIKNVDLKAAVITVSTTRNKENDGSGKEIKSLLKKNNIPIIYYKIIPDLKEIIKETCEEALLTCNCIIINGGTGLTHDDCTVEAITPILEKKIDGFGELFRMKSYEDIGTRALLSRAVAGIINKKVVFCIPGSTSAVKLAMNEIILPEIRHILTHAGK